MNCRCTIAGTMIAALLFSSLPYSARAEHGRHEARRLLQQGEIQSLEKILAQARRTYPGKILEVELEKERDLIIYELEILGDDGVVRKVIVNARNGEILTAREKTRK